MSDIDIQIENNKRSIEELKQKREDLNRQIGDIKERLNKKSITLINAMKQIQLRKDQIEKYDLNIGTLEGLNKKLKRAKPKKEDLTPEQQLSEDDEDLEELNRMIEEENIKQSQQQQQNLSEREKAYQDTTGKKYNPLVKD